MSVDNECLLGSRTLPSTFRYNGKHGRTVQLGEIVREGLRRSGVTVQMWNEMVRTNPEFTDGILRVIVEDWSLE